MLFNQYFQEELLNLLKINTVTPMETGIGSEIQNAIAEFAQLSKKIGMQVVFEGTGELPLEADIKIPLMIHRKMQEMPEFLESQPHLVLEIGKGSFEQTLVFNFHMDTVSPHLPVSIKDGIVYGRGTVDNKGPGLAILAALSYVEQAVKEVFENVRILIHVVSGEEGGAMGIYGTKYLADRGYLGRLNVFVEPTNGSYFDTSTTSMTYEVEFEGLGSTDDFPEKGQNATLALSFLAQHMGSQLSHPLNELGVKMTISGIHTGHLHNRVYGKGRLLFNFAYSSLLKAKAAKNHVEAAFKSGIEEFMVKFATLAPFVATVEALQEICHGRWVKDSLPVLDNRDSKMEALLASINLKRNTNISDTFTCDAIWGQLPDGYCIVFGPGSLGENGAHTQDEHLALTELELFTCKIAELIIAFAANNESSHIK